MTTFQPESPWRHNPLRLMLWAVPAALLLVPAVAMQFTSEVRWGALDFAFMGGLLFGTTGLIDLALRRSENWAYRLGAAVGLVTAFLLVWVNAAVGVIGDEGHPANLLFAGVIVLAAGGAALARLEPRGMARAMLATAAATEAIALVALVAGWGTEDPPGTTGLFTLITAFAALWLLSAGLFGRAASRNGQT